MLCPRCEKDRIDLADNDALDRLAIDWPMVALFRDGVSVTAARSLRHPRIAWIATLFLLVLTATLVTLVSIAPRSEPHELILFFAFVAAILGPFIVIVAARFVRLKQRADTLASSPPRGSFWVPTIELDAMHRPPVLGTAALLHELTVFHVRDLGSWMPRDDAWTSGCELELEGERLRLELAVGTITWSASELPRATQEGDAGYRAASRVGMPIWARDARREMSPRMLVIPARTELIVLGGRVADGALWGTREHPLHLEVREVRA